MKVKPLLEMVGDWREFIKRGLDRDEVNALRKHERTGRPLGDEAFVTNLEKTLTRALRPQKPGPKKQGAKS